MPFYPRNPVNLNSLGGMFSNLEPFSPGNIPGLVAWYDPSDTSSITESTGAVSAIADLGTGGLNLLQGNASFQPTTGTRSINSLNVLDFDGTEFMSKSGFPVPASGNLTLCMVAELDATVLDTNSIVSMDASRDYQIDAGNASQWNGRMRQSSLGGAGDANWTGGPYNSDPHVFCIVFDFTNSIRKAYIDGVQVMVDNAYTAKLNVSQNLRAFANRAGNDYCNGAMGEFYLAESCATACLAQSFAYLGDKWGITIS